MKCKSFITFGEDHIPDVGNMVIFGKEGDNE
jgi:hypothetical protein